MDEAKGKPADKQPDSNPADRLKEHRWPKGQSGNPGGRKKGSVNLLSLIRQKLAENPGQADAIVDNFLDMCEAADDKGLRAFGQLLDRMHGTPTKVIEHHVSDSTGKAPVIILNPGNTPVAEEPKEEEADGQ